jgi:hypothetical protein
MNAPSVGVEPATEGAFDAQHYIRQEFEKPTFSRAFEDY